MRICSYACLQRDPSRMPPHAFHNKATLMGFSRCVEPVDFLHGDVGGGVKSKRPVGAGKVIVDRLWPADHVHAELAQRIGHAERIVSANGNQPFKLKAFHCIAHHLRPVFEFHDIGARTAQDGSAQGLNAFHVCTRQPTAFIFQHAAPACIKAENGDVLLDAARNYAADHRV